MTTNSIFDNIFEKFDNKLITVLSYVKMFTNAPNNKLNE